MVDAIAFLEGHLRTSILNDVKDVARYHSEHQTKHAGFFGVPRNVFCYVDFLGFIAYGNSNKSTKNAIQFIKDFFPNNYTDYAELLYSMWRHGTVHEYSPRSFYYEDFSTREMVVCVSWLCNNKDKPENRKEHMKFYSLQNSNRNVRLVVNTCQLVDDLLTALANFISRLYKDKAYAFECGERLDECKSIREYTYMPNKCLQKKVRNQLESVWNNRSGEIDKKGNIVKRYQS